MKKINAKSFIKAFVKAHKLAKIYGGKVLEIRYTTDKNGVIYCNDTYVIKCGNELIKINQAFDKNIMRIKTSENIFDEVAFLKAI